MAIEQNIYTDSKDLFLQSGSAVSWTLCKEGTGTQQTVKDASTQSDIIGAPRSFHSLAQESFFSFDTSDLEPTAIILSATLTLHVPLKFSSGFNVQGFNIAHANPITFSDWAKGSVLAGLTPIIQEELNDITTGTDHEFAILTPGDVINKDGTTYIVMAEEHLADNLALSPSTEYGINAYSADKVGFISPTLTVNWIESSGMMGFIF